METKKRQAIARDTNVTAPSDQIEGCTIVVSGNLIKTASVHEENWLEGEIIKDPGSFIAKVKESGLKADIFAFSQKISDPKPRHSYHFDWDNVAAIPIITFADWWEKRLSRKARQEVARAERLGVVIKCVEFGDELSNDIVKLFGQIRTKQGRAFSHHGMDVEAVNREVSTFPERSQFIGAYYGNEMIGYLKLVYIDNVGSILNIITNNIHYDKRPGNALIAKAVRICEDKKLSHLLYGKFTYGNKTRNSLTEFKRRNGFEKIQIPRYYVPLGLKGRAAIKMKLHLGLLGILPPGLISLLLKCRSMLHRSKAGVVRQERINDVFQ